MSTIDRNQATGKEINEFYNSWEVKGWLYEDRLTSPFSRYESNGQLHLPEEPIFDLRLFGEFVSEDTGLDISFVGAFNQWQQELSP